MVTKYVPTQENQALKPALQENPQENKAPEKPVEVGGPTGLEPTRYGDWERGGRCIDF